MTVIPLRNNLTVPLSSVTQPWPSFETFTSGNLNGIGIEFWGADKLIVETGGFEDFHFYHFDDGGYVVFNGVVDPFLTAGGYGLIWDETTSIVHNMYANPANGGPGNPWTIGDFKTSSIAAHDGEIIPDPATPFDEYVFGMFDTYLVSSFYSYQLADENGDPFVLVGMVPASDLEHMYVFGIVPNGSDLEYRNAMDLGNPYYNIMAMYGNIQYGGNNRSLIRAEKLLPGPTIVKGWIGVDYQLTAFDPTGSFTSTIIDEYELDDPVLMADILNDANPNNNGGIWSPVVMHNNHGFMLARNSNYFTGTSDVPTMIFVAADFSYYDIYTFDVQDADAQTMVDQFVNGDPFIASYCFIDDLMYFACGPDSPFTYATAPFVFDVVVPQAKNINPENVLPLGCWSPCNNLAIRIAGKDKI